MACENIYGVCLDDSFDSSDVLDAIVNCFSIAHKKFLTQLEESDEKISDEELKKISKFNSRETVEKIFRDKGMDITNPSRDSILVLLDELKKYSSKFRDPEVIQKHYSQIMKLVNKLD
jgi:hypothetical protein